jgi:hypothetical protein
MSAATSRRPELSRNATMLSVESQEKRFVDEKVVPKHGENLADDSSQGIIEKAEDVAIEVMSCSQTVIK